MTSKIIDDYNKGMTLNAIGEKYGISAYKVRKVIVRAGIKIRNSQEAAKRNRQPISAESYKMKECQDQGMTYEQIAEKFYCHVSTVNSRLRKLRRSQLE